MRESDQLEGVSAIMLIIIWNRKTASTKTAAPKLAVGQVGCIKGVPVLSDLLGGFRSFPIPIATVGPLFGHGVRIPLCYEGVTASVEGLVRD